MPEQYYKIITGTKQEVEDKVNQSLSAGFELYGNTFTAWERDYTYRDVVIMPQYAQAMTLKKPE